MVLKKRFSFALAIILVLSFFQQPVCAAEKKVLVEKAEQLKGHLEKEEYDQALRAVEELKWKIYDHLVAEKKPELQGSTYINHYYGLRIANPIEEWRIEPLQVESDLRRKQSRITQNLVKIFNPASPYEMQEHLMVSAYDIGKSFDGSFISDLQFREKAFIKKFAEQQLKGQRDAELIDKRELTVAGRSAYQTTTTLDTGTRKKAVMMNVFVYDSEKRFVLILTFVMYEDNHSVYKHLFDAILETLKLGDGYASPFQPEQKSFMDIYLERAKA